MAKSKTPLADLIPTNWLDPLLTGPGAVIGKPPYPCHEVERLLIAIKERVGKAERSRISGVISRG